MKWLYLLDPWRWRLVSESHTPSEYTRRERCRWTGQERIRTYITGRGL